MLFNKYNLNNLLQRDSEEATFPPLLYFLCFLIVKTTKVNKNNNNIGGSRLGPWGTPHFKSSTWHSKVLHRHETVKYEMIKHPECHQPPWSSTSNITKLKMTQSLNRNQSWLFLFNDVFSAAGPSTVGMFFMFKLFNQWFLIKNISGWIQLN